MDHKISETVECQMMVRIPVEQVFEAFIDPNVTTHFWFTHSSGKLEKGKTVKWEWKMYGVSMDVKVIDIIPYKKIAIEWDSPSTFVDFEFEKLANDQTYVIIKNYGFQVKGDDLLMAIKDSTGGFTTVLDGMKAYLEHGIDLQLILDKYPQTEK